jgi:hypothetical protein
VRVQDDTIFQVVDDVRPTILNEKDVGLLCYKKQDGFMLCYHCGKEVVDGSIFCSSCGKRRDPVQVLRQRTLIVIDKKNENPKTTHRILDKGMMIVFGIIILSVIIFFIVYMMR